MSRRANDKNQAILKALLKEEGNNVCADCKTNTHPRWASWNLGIFICIRCSGIHRSMGTHISRVKSVDLDTWTNEQVESMVKWGNFKANQYWEYKLPGGKHTPEDSKIENFIRTKYDLKKWVSSPQIPNPSSLNKAPLTVETDVSLSTSTNINNNSNPTSTTVKRLSNNQSINSNLLDLEFGSPISAPTKSPPLNPIHQSSSNSNNLAQLAQSSDNQQHNNTLHQQPYQQPQQQQNQRDNSRPELKKSILSLYSTPLNISNSTPNFHPTAQNLASPSIYSTNSHSNSLNGLNFNSSTPTFSQATTPPTALKPKAPSAQAQSTSLSTPAQNQWNSVNVTDGQANNGIGSWNNTSNPWSSVPSQSSRVNTTSNIISNQGFVDDPFKNVWK